MEAKEYKKEIDLRIKKYFGSIQIENTKPHVRNRLVNIIDNHNNILANITYSYSSGKFIDLGAILTLQLTALITAGRLNDIINCLNLEMLITPHIGIPFYTGLYEFTKTDEYKGGPNFSFYSSKKLEDRINFLTSSIDNDIVPRIDNFLNYKLDSIENIFSKPNFYQYPAISILCILFLNKKEDLIKKYIEMDSFKKFYDYKIINNDLIDNICDLSK